MTGRSWALAAFSGFFWVFISVHFNQIASTVIPHSWWYDLKPGGAQVRSVYDGESPQVILDRTIGTRLDNLVMKTELYPVSGSGSDYRNCPRVRQIEPKDQGAVFGENGPVTLAMIQDSPPNPPCIFENGNYRVDFTPTATDVFWWLPGVTLSYTVPSNIFIWQDGE